MEDFISSRCNMEIRRKDYCFNTVIVGTGAAGYNAAASLLVRGMKDFAIVSDNRLWGTSRNAGSDKQTYYRIHATGRTGDSAYEMASALFSSGSTDGDTAYAEAALSLECFYNLVRIGVPFPRDEYGDYPGYKTDHDEKKRGTSAGPYTSRIMTEKLEKEVLAQGVNAFDNQLLVHIVTSQGEISGAIFLEIEQLRNNIAEFSVFRVRNLILATGGPGGIYSDSVYPHSQSGASGIAFLAGIKAQNLTEWQYGLSSVNPRWNVSGSYMQVLPRFFSTEADGTDEREFLSDYIPDERKLLDLIFLKGYQWPFDIRKVSTGSSIIDIIVYLERRKGRRVFLDFTRNPFSKAIDFKGLSNEAKEYLEGADICFGTPIQRLSKLNQPAIDFYKDKGVDLHHDPLEIAFCAQHNNGGLAVDINWETNIRGIFACGEISGTHGITRPGGSALNESQVGSLQAASYICRMRRGNPEVSSAVIDQAFEEEVNFFSSLKSQAKIPIRKLYESIREEMSTYASAFRNHEKLLILRKKLEELVTDYPQYAAVADGKDYFLAYRTYCIALAQYAYVSAFCDYAAVFGKSHGSALYYDTNGDKPYDFLPEEFRYSLDPMDRNLIQETVMEDGKFSFSWRPPRPIPCNWPPFEAVWKDFRDRQGL